MTIGDVTRQYIDKKVERLRRLVPKIDEMNFTLSKEKLAVCVEASFKAGKIAAQAATKANHAHEAIDMLVDKLEAQITKAKKRVSDKSAAAREAARVAGQDEADEAVADDEESEEEEEEDEDEAEGPDPTRAMQG
jgi:ribosomal subunit interface protein